MRSSGHAVQEGAMKKKTYLCVELALALLLLLSTGILHAQTALGTLRGTVTDPSGALVPLADLALTNSTGFSRKLKSGAAGTFEVTRLVPGRYTLTVKAKGFTSTDVKDILVYGDKVTSQTVELEIAAEDEVNVEAEETGVSVSPDDNASALVIKGKDLDALSDQPQVPAADRSTSTASPAASFRPRAPSARSASIAIPSPPSTTSSATAASRSSPSPAQTSSTARS
jgi:hypothetical protein